MATPFDPITNGKNFNMFQKINVIPVTFNFLCDIAINFRGQRSFSLINEGGSVIQYSTNGQTIDGDLTPATPSAALFFENRRISKLWFCVPSGVASVVRFEAWAQV